MAETGLRQNNAKIDDHIVMPEPPQQPIIVAASSAPPKKVKRAYLRNVFEEVFGLLFWIYVITKLFVIDVDRYLLIRYAPSAVWLLDFKLFFLVGLVAVVILLRRKSEIMWFLVAVIFYPLIIVARFIHLVFRQRSWSLGLGVINAFANFFGSLKHNFLMCAGFLITTALIVFCNARHVVLVGVMGIVALLAYAIVRRFVLVFRQSTASKVYVTVTRWLPKIRTNMFALEESAKGLRYEDLTHEQAEKWKGSLQASIVLSRLCLFVARKLRDYGRSKLTKAASVFIILLMLAETVVTFTLANYGLWKFDPLMFKIESGAPGLFDFFYYSFNRIGFSSISEIVPSMVAAKILYVGEAACAMFIIAILISLLLSTRDEAQTEELNETIRTISSEGRAMEQLILVEYQFENLEAALTMLKQAKAGMIDWIYKLSEDIE